MKTKYILAAIALVLGITSCAKDEIMYYEGTDKIHFTYAYIYDPKLGPQYRDILFAYTKTPVQDSIVSIEVVTVGNTLPYERFFSLGVIDSLSSAKLGEDYELLPSSIAANQIKGYARVKIKNTEKLKTDTLTLTVRLQDNENFTTGVKLLSKREGLNFKINFTNIRTKPLSWVYYSNNFNMFFGPYSQVKYETILKVCGFDNDYFEFDDSDKTLFGKRFPTSAMAGWISMVNRYLLAYYMENGSPLLDEFGNEVWMAKDYN